MASTPLFTDSYNPGAGFVRNPRSFTPNPTPNPAHPGVVRPHWGDDWGTNRIAGISVPIAADGIVAKVGFDPQGWGNYVVVQHTREDGSMFRTLYAHLASQSPLIVGSSVDAGQPVGVAGSTGGSTGIHLHFEILQGGGAATAGAVRNDPASFTSWGNISHMVGSDASGNQLIAQQTGSVRNGDWTQTIYKYDPTRIQLIDASSTRTTALDDGGGNTRGWQVSNTYADGASYVGVVDAQGNLLKSTEYTADNRTITTQAGVRFEYDNTTGIKIAFVPGGPQAGVPVQPDGSFTVSTQSGPVTIRLNSDPFAGGIVSAGGQTFQITGGESLGVQGNGLGVSGVVDGNTVRDRLIEGTGSGTQFDYERQPSLIDWNELHGNTNDSIVLADGGDGSVLSDAGNGYTLTGATQIGSTGSGSVTNLINLTTTGDLTRLEGSDKDIIDLSAGQEDNNNLLLGVQLSDDLADASSAFKAEISKIASEGENTWKEEHADQRRGQSGRDELFVYGLPLPCKAPLARRKFQNRLIKSVSASNQDAVNCKKQINLKETT